MAIGIHDAALVIALAMSEYMLNNSEMAIPPALYGLVAYITAGYLSGGSIVINLRSKQGTAQAARRGRSDREFARLLSSGSRA
jgi:predicted Na+-dependent transporter